MRRRIPRGLILPVALAVAVGALASAYGQQSQFDLAETQARQLAIRILRALQPMEDWIETATVAEPAPPSTKRLVEITGARVNLRTGPSTETAVLGAAHEGEVYEYIRTEGDWHFIRMDEARQGYVSTRFSRLVSAEEARPPVSTTSETLDTKYHARVRQVLSDNKSAMEALKAIASNAQADFDKQYKGKKALPEDREFWAATESLVKIRRYENGAVGQFDRFGDLAGGDIPTPRAAPEWTKSFRGTASAGLGSNTAKTKQGGVTVADADVTRSEFAVDVSADLTQNDRLGIAIGRSEEISFAPIARTNAGVNYRRKLGEKANVSARAGLRKYANDNDDTSDLDQTELALQASMKPSKSLRANANIGLAGASYPNNSDLDYSDTRFGIGLVGDAGGKTAWGAKFAHAAHDVDLSTSTNDNTRNRIEGNISLKSGAQSSFDISAHSENNEFDQSADRRTYTRRGLKLALRKRGEPGNSSNVSFEILQKKYDTDDDRDYSDLRGELRSDKLGSDSHRSSSRFWVNYRHFKGNGTQGYLDYVEGRSDVVREPGSGFFWESNLYGQYFLENNDVKRDALVTQFAWLGMVAGREGAFKIGPHVATNTILAVADRPPGQDVGTFEHAGNTVRYGAKAAVDVRGKPLSIRGSGRYEMLKYYNVDNSPSPSRMELEGEGKYQIGQRVDASVKLKFYSTGSNDPDAAETSEFDVLFGLIYRIGGQQ